jgi:hypothetical protein
MRHASSSRLSPVYQKMYAALYGRAQDKRSSFRRDRLPHPAEYYRKHLDKLHVRGDWADARCPLHQDNNPSLSVNLDHGGYLCRGCGAKGGDMLAFHMRFKNMDFVSAARDLNAWEVDQ